METRINVKLEFNSIIIGINELVALDQKIKKIGPLVDEKIRELKNEEKTTRIFKLKGAYSDKEFKAMMILRGVNPSQIKELKALAVYNNVTIVGPINFINKVEEQHQQAQYYNDLLESHRNTFKDIQLALKQLEHVNPNDLIYSGVSVLEWIDLNYFIKNAVKIMFQA